MTSEESISRRQVIAVGAAAAAVVPLAGCGSSPVAVQPSEPGSGGKNTRSAGGGSPALAKVSDVPVGSAVSAKTSDGRPAIVSRPKSGEILALSAVCTHMGCTVAPSGDQLHCPCHGSVYDEFGKVLHGPAPRALPRIPVVVRGGQVFQQGG